MNMEFETLDYIALGMIMFVSLVLFYGIIAVHDIPYEIAKRRNHAHQEAIHYAGWISMFTLHVIWPFLWIWATLYRADIGYGFSNNGIANQNISDRLAEVENRLIKLEPPETASEGHAAAPGSSVSEPIGQEKG